MLDPGDAPLTPEEPATPSASGSGRADGSLQPTAHRLAGGAGRSSPFLYDADADALRDGGTGSIHDGAEAAAIAARRTFFLETRPDWLTAVRREDARTIRYDRPVSVVLLELTGEAPGPQLEAIAGDLAEVIRSQSRSTDRAVRFSATGFRILMPETSEASARVVAARLQRTFASTPAGRRGDGLNVEVATSSRVRSLVDALAAAEERLVKAGPRRFPPPA